MITRNENGYVIVMALLILAILTIIGTSALQISITEQKISTNFLIHEMNFYAAESGVNIAPLWVSVHLDESDYDNVDYLGTFEGDIGTNNFYSVEVEHQVGVDTDGVVKVLRYGDEDGDYLNEINFTTGMPLEKATSYGTHKGRGGKSAIEVRFIHEPLFMMPNAALRVNSSVNGNGVAGSIIGENQAGSDCGDVADIMYDIAGGTIDYDGDMGDTPVVEQSTGMYPFPLIEPIINKNATHHIIGSNNMTIPASSQESPAIIHITGDGKMSNITGYGILLITGKLDLSGNLDWHGIIIAGDDIVLSGGGTKTVYGAVIGMGEAIAINGSVDIQYDCDVLSELHGMSRYRRLSWRQI